MKRGILLFAHGARDPNWALPFAEVARRVASEGVETRLAFLEFMAPDILEAGRQLAEAGCTRVDIVPLFLGAGGHVRKDLPVLVGQLRAAHQAVDWTLRPAVGESEHVIDAMAAEALAAMK